MESDINPNQSLYLDIGTKRVSPFTLYIITFFVHFNVPLVRATECWLPQATWHTGMSHRTFRGLRGEETDKSHLKYCSEFRTLIVSKWFVLTVESKRGVSPRRGRRLSQKAVRPCHQCNSQPESSLCIPHTLKVHRRQKTFFCKNFTSKTLNKHVSPGQTHVETQRAAHSVFLGLFAHLRPDSYERWTTFHYFLRRRALCDLRTDPWRHNRGLNSDPHHLLSCWPVRLLWAESPAGCPLPTRTCWRCVSSGPTADFNNSETKLKSDAKSVVRKGKQNLNMAGRNETSTERQTILVSYEKENESETNNHILTVFFFCKYQVIKVF